MIRDALLRLLHFAVQLLLHVLLSGHRHCTAAVVRPPLLTHDCHAVAAATNTATLVLQLIYTGYFRSAHCCCSSYRYSCRCYRWRCCCRTCAAASSSPAPATGRSSCTAAAAAASTGRRTRCTAARPRCTPGTAACASELALVYSPLPLLV